MSFPRISNAMLRKIAFVLLATLPVIIFTFKFAVLNRHGIFRGEDWDYFAQSYEAARLSILHYHQFPWWNPWMNGGQPLFANPQFGLFSLHMPLVLLFGTVAGLHLSILMYYILGFWGMYLLLKRIGTKDILLVLLLAYIWTFSGFSAWHLAGGQFTFAVYFLAPWAFLTILNIHKKLGWLWFGLVASLLIQTSAHYLTVEALVICLFIAIFQFAKLFYSQRKWTINATWQIFKPYLLALGIILVLCGVRLFYTLQFTHQYPRIEPLDAPVSLMLFIASITFRHPINPGVFSRSGISAYGWTEFADYFGLITVALFCYLIIKKLEKINSITLEEWAILVATMLAGVITLGAFNHFSPYSLVHHLPIFNQMRVPSRFIGWMVLGIIIFLAKLPKKSTLFYILLAISTVDVFIVTYPSLNYAQTPYIQTTRLSDAFQEYEFFQTNPSLGQIGILNIQNLRLLRALQSNKGEVYGYEPILNVGEYYFLPGTSRCGINHGCNFVLTHNAKVTYWSPLKINLIRTGSGPIKLNMNPGKVWVVNDKALFPKYKILELQKDFTINDPSAHITVQYKPTL